MPAGSHFPVSDKQSWNHLPVSPFDLPVSYFQLPVSIFQFPFSEFPYPPTVSGAVTFASSVSKELGNAPSLLRRY